MNARLFEDRAMREELWAGATVEALQQGWTVSEQADYYASGFVRAVVAGDMTAGHLRRYVNDLHVLNEEVMTASAGDIESLGDADYFEATARRIAQGACSRALRQVKTGRLRFRAALARGDLNRKGFAAVAEQVTLVASEGDEHHATV